MSKPFITYTAQVEKLKNEKNLVITDDDFAVDTPAEYQLLCINWRIQTSFY